MMEEHATIDELMEHLGHYSPSVAQHVAHCEVCRRTVARLQDQANNLLDPLVPALSEDQMNAMISGVLDEVLGDESGVPEQAPSEEQERAVATWSWPLRSLALAAGLLLTLSAGAAVGALVLREFVAPPKVPPAPAVAPIQPLPIVAPQKADPKPPTPIKSKKKVVKPIEPVEAAPEVVEEAPEEQKISLKKEAIEALARRDIERSRGLLLILSELHPEMDLRSLHLVEHALREFKARPNESIAALEAYLIADPQGPLAAECRQWLCELDKSRCP